MKKLTLFVVAAFAMANAFGEQQGMEKVIIAGKVINGTIQTPKVLKFNFCNPLIDGSQSAQLDAANQFVVSEDMMYAQNMTVQFKNYFINLYVQPGDSVHLTIDAALIDRGNFEWLTITGDNASISKQLNLTVNYLYRLPIQNKNLSLAPDALLASLKLDYERYLSALNEFARLENIEPMVVNWAKRDLIYLLSNSIVEYGGPGQGEEFSKFEQIKMFSDPFFDMYNADNFQSMLYEYHLIHYASLIQKADSTIAAALTENKIVEAAKKKLMVIIKEPAGEARDYMLYRVLSGMAKDYPGILDSLPALDSHFNTAIYKNYLHKAAIPGKPVFKSTPINGITYISEVGEVNVMPKLDFFSFLKAKYPGKVVYVDVYATWCGPCLVEFEKTPDLHTSMTGKDVVFVNLCLQSSMTAWKKLLNEKNIKGENYFFDDDASKLFMGTYKLLGYPSYILVDKNGEIVSTTAPRPSEPALRDKLANLLE